MNTGSARPSIILVHGARHGRWCWSKVVESLGEYDVDVVAPELPFTGFAADVAMVREAVDGVAGDVIVCGHSYGGRVVSAAVEPGTRSTHLVYIAAPLPNADQVDDYQRSVRALPPQDARPYEMERQRLFNDCSDEVAADAWRQLRPMILDVPELSFDRPPWTVAPTTYIVCGRDLALEPRLQRMMAENAQFVVELDTGHSPFLSQPQRLATILAETALLSR